MNDNELNNILKLLNNLEKEEGEEGEEEIEDNCETITDQHSDLLIFAMDTLLQSCDSDLKKLSDSLTEKGNKFVEFYNEQYGEKGNIFEFLVIIDSLRFIMCERLAKILEATEKDNVDIVDNTVEKIRDKIE